MITTFNDKVLCFPYTKKGDGMVKKEVVTGFVGVAQKQILALLEVAEDCKLRDGTLITKGSFLILEESLLATKAWSDKGFFIEGNDKKMVVVDFINVIGVQTKDS